MPHDSVSPTPRSQTAHVDDVGRVHAHELDVGAIREAGVELDAGTVQRRPAPRAGSMTKQTRCGIADVGDVAPVLDAVDGDLDVFVAEGDRAHVDVGGDDGAGSRRG